MKSHIPRKRFGQHFLSDSGVIDEIVRAIDPRPGQALVEIGPGLAALTNPVVERSGQLTVIELDRDLAARMRARGDVTVIESDVLKVDFAQLARDRGVKLRLIGNLPYNISSPILFHLLPCADVVVDQHFMLQKEVVDRMVAAPATAAYGRLSVMLQWRYAMEMTLFVPPTAFDPPPRVDSAVVRMVPRPDAAPVSLALLSELVQVAFSQSTRWPSLDLDRAEGCIRSNEHAFSKEGGLAVLTGNIALDGCVVKTAGVDDSILVFEGKKRIRDHGTLPPVMDKHRRPCLLHGEGQGLLCTLVPFILRLNGLEISEDPVDHIRGKSG